MISILCKADIDTVEIWNLLISGTTPDINKYYKKDNMWCWVYKVKGEIVGFILYTQLTTKILVDQFHIIPEFRDTEVKKELLQHVVSKVKDRELVILVSEKYTDTHNVLKELGFSSEVEYGEIYRFTFKRKVVA